MPQATPRETLEQLRALVARARTLAHLSRDPVVHQVIGAGELLVDVIAHQVAKWEQADRLQDAFMRAAAIGVSGGDPTEVIREIAADYLPGGRYNPN